MVACDIDGVMADFNAAMKPLSLVKDTEEVCPAHYNFVESGWFNNFDDFEAAHVKVMDSASTIPLADTTAAQAVQFLIDSGFEVIAVTARREMWRSETEKFFRVNGINITPDRLFFMDKANKSEKHFHYLIDDAPKNIINAVVNTHSMPVIYHQRYNAHLPGMRAHTLMDFARTISHHRDMVVDKIAA